jgi:hypothetical protein
MVAHQLGVRFAARRRPGAQQSAPTATRVIGTRPACTMRAQIRPTPPPVLIACRRPAKLRTPPRLEPLVALNELPGHHCPTGRLVLSHFTNEPLIAAYVDRYVRDWTELIRFLGHMTRWAVPSLTRVKVACERRQEKET